MWTTGLILAACVAQQTAPPPPAHAGETVDLSITWPAALHDRYALSLHITQRRASAEAAGANAVWTLAQEAVLERRVLEPAGVRDGEGGVDAGPTLEVVYREVRAEVDAGLLRVRFDSRDDPRDDEAGGPGTALRAIIGRPVIIRFDAEGRPSRVDPPADLPDPGAWRSVVDNLVSPRAMMAVLEPMLIPPRRPARATIGESWSDPPQPLDGRAGPGTLVARVERTLSGATGGHATITVSGVFEEMVGEGAAAVRVERGTITGMVVWDAGSGSLVSAETTRVVAYSEVDATESRTVLRRLKEGEPGFSVPRP